CWQRPPRLRKPRGRATNASAASWPIRRKSFIEGKFVQYASLEQFMEHVRSRNPGQPEFQQAVAEVMQSLWPFIQKNPRYSDAALLETLVEPDRLIQFRVSWTDDSGRTRVNRAFRVQHSAA